MGGIALTLIWVATSSSSDSSDGPGTPATTPTRSYGEIIAAEMEGDSNPDRALILRFEALITALNARCARDRETISDRILVGHRLLTSRGGDASLLDVAVAYERENGRLKRAVADLTLDKLILEEAAKGNS